MKTVLLILVAWLMAGINLFSQDNFTGEWEMQELVMESLEEREVVSKEQLKQDGTIWIMKFSEDGKFYQKSNYNAQERMDEFEGSWKAEPDEKLTIFLMINGQKRPLHFFYEFRENKMILERYDPARTMKMVVVFRKRGS
ncbi:MAG: hypothetical protein WD052_10730 [Bacteroidales bacterium]